MPRFDDDLFTGESIEEQNVSDIIYEAFNQIMDYKEFEDVLKGECCKETAKYNDYSFESDWCKKTDNIWKDFPEHKQGTVYVSPELSVLWPMIKKFDDPKEAASFLKQWYRDNVVQAQPNTNPPKDKVIAVDTTKVPKDIWFMSTIKGVNLRPGIRANEEGKGYDKTNTEPLHLNDDNVHGLLAGRTGSGKSVALNAIIASLLEEYSPWELDINLADFKKVEMSRYGQVGYEAPHVSKIAATGSMEYVVSSLYDLYAEMDCRQNFFTKVGVNKISDFRSAFGVVLPHVVLIIDEFQQMYQLASSRQEQVINKLITMIVKLGRATGYHLLFASQNMSGTLSGEVLGNFKMRIALPCDANTSGQVLGNDESSKLIGKGYCWTNCEGGDKTFNRKYNVPFLNAEDVDKDTGETPLQKILRNVKEIGDNVGYRRSLNFFQEDVVRPMERPDSGENDRLHSFDYDIEILEKNKQKWLSKHPEAEDVLLLGDSFVYRVPGGKKFNCTVDTMPLLMTDKANICCLGDTPLDRAYYAELLAKQYARRGERNANIVCNTDIVMSDLFDINEVLGSCGSDVQAITSREVIDTLNRKYQTRKILRQYNEWLMMNSGLTQEEKDAELLKETVEVALKDANDFFPCTPDDFSVVRNTSAVAFAERFAKYIVCDTRESIYKDLTKGEQDEAVKQAVEKIMNNGLDEESAKAKAEVDKENIFREYLQEKNETLYTYIDALKGIYNKMKVMYQSALSIDSDGAVSFNFRNMQSITIWLIGFSGIPDISGERNKASKIEDMLKDCSNVGIRVIFIGSNLEDIYECQRNIKYFFITSANEKNFTKLNIDQINCDCDALARVYARGTVLESGVKMKLYPVNVYEKIFKKYDKEFTVSAEVNILDDYD